MISFAKIAIATSWSAYLEAGEINPCHNEVYYSQVKVSITDDKVYSLNETTISN
jgi:hypothetical protein